MGGCCSTGSDQSPPRHTLASNSDINQIVSNFTENQPGNVSENNFVFKQTL